MELNIPNHCLIKYGTQPSGVILNRNVATVQSGKIPIDSTWGDLVGFAQGVRAEDDGIYIDLVLTNAWRVHSTATAEEITQTYLFSAYFTQVTFEEDESTISSAVLRAVTMIPNPEYFHYTT